MPSFTNWRRLEPRARSEAMRASLEGRIHDPLWLLARQWQFGEFKGEDAASPVVASLTAQRSPITRYAPGRPTTTTRGIRYDGTQLPLETMVEREAARSPVAPNARDAAQAGLHFFRLLGGALATRYRAEYLRLYALAEPPEDERKLMDGASLRFLDLVVGRVPDGAKLYDALNGALRPASGTGGTLPLEPGMQSSDDARAVTGAAIAWLQWYDELCSQPTAATTPAWVPSRLEYECAVAAPKIGPSSTPVTLVAPDYAGGHLDWYSFDVAPGIKLGATPDAGIQTIERRVLPSPVTFGGMPSSRWWEFEDGRINFGAIDAAPEDLARLLLVEFALIYGNDFFVIPVDLPVGSVCTITRLEVFDTFGGRTAIGPAPTGEWRMFEPEVDRRMVRPPATPRVFFLPPVLGPSLESAPVEDVLLTRDEMANMAWGVERLVEGPSGVPIDRFRALQEMRRRDERDREAATPGSTAPHAGPLEYRAMTEVPANWIPLVPVRIQPKAGREIGLQLREITDTGLRIPPLGKLLTPVPGSALILNEEELPRAGARVTRSYQYARWTDGSTHLWLARRKRTGRGEGSSGLRFDVVEPQ